MTAPVELFSVTCITCRSKLKVRHESAIGQILACPKCNGMVQIEPPPGWKPPAKSAAAEQQPPAASGPRHPRPTTSTSDAPPPADDAPLAPLGMIVAPHEAQARKWILIGGGLLAVLIIGFGLWTSFLSRSEPSIDEPLAEASPTKSATRPRASASPTPSPTAATVSSATPSASPSSTPPAAAASPTPAATASVPAPAPTAIASATATPTAAPSGSPPIVVASASPSAKPPEVVASATPRPTVPLPIATAAAPRPVPTATAPSPAIGPQIDLAARLADKIPELNFDRTPLRQTLDLISQLSTIRIQYDADSIAAADVSLDAPVTLALNDATVEAAIAKLTAERGLQFRPASDRLVVFAPGKDATAAATVSYPIDDLVGTDDAATHAVADLVRRFVVPDAWDEKWGGRLDVSPGKLEVTQQAAGRREAAAFLDRLRLARGNAPKDSQATLVTRLQQARERLDAPVTMNFRPAATLPEIAARIESATGAMLLINYLELATQGFFGSETIGIAADKQPAERVLGALCDPRDWAWRIVGPKIIEITTRDAVRRRPYVEFYALPANPALELDGPGWVTKIRTALADEPWRDVPGIDLETAGEIVFDAPSQRLIVRQHQGAQARIERLLAESVKSPPATPAPRASPSPSAARPSATPSGTATAKP